MTKKLKYDFDPSLVSQVQTASKTWVRVPATTFRSWDGPRRIMNRETGEMEMWYGNIYLYGYNDRVEARHICNIRYPEDYVEPSSIKKSYGV